MYGCICRIVDHLIHSQWTACNWLYSVKSSNSFLLFLQFINIFKLILTRLLLIEFSLKLCLKTSHRNIPAYDVTYARRFDVYLLLCRYGGAVWPELTARCHQHQQDSGACEKHQTVGSTKAHVQTTRSTGYRKCICWILGRWKLRRSQLNTVRVHRSVSLWFSLWYLLSSLLPAGSS